MRLQAYCRSRLEPDASAADEHGDDRSRIARNFKNASDRAYSGKERIKARLIGDFDPQNWELPPKPKWMRWATYNRYVERFDDYEERLDNASIASVCKRLRLKSV